MDGPTFVAVDGLFNFRDLGGYPTDAGRVRTGRVYRSDALHLATDDGVEALRRLGIATVLDLRTATERTEQPNPLPSEHHPIQEHVEDGPDPRARSGREGGEALLRDLYVQLLEDAAARYGVVLTALSVPERLPAVIHCAGGKDRTGLAVALLLSALGVRRELILDDYAAPPAGEAHAAHLDGVLDRFATYGIPRDVGTGMLSTPRWAMAEALEDLDARHGSVDAYLLGPCAVTPATLEALRAQLVDVR